MQGARTIFAASVLVSIVALTNPYVRAQDPNDAPIDALDSNSVGFMGRSGRQTSVIAPDANGIGGVRLRLNFQDAPLQVVLEYLSEKTGLTIVSETPPSGRITVISRREIPLDTAIGLINSVLVESDMTAVRTEGTLKIVTIDQARQMNIPFSYGNDPDAMADDDEVITHVLPLRYVNAASLRQNLLALLPEYAIIEANADGNSLIITDTRANIKRLMRIVQALDMHMASVAEIRVFRLINADATSAANLINSIFQETARASTSSRQGGRGSAIDMIMQRGGPMGRDSGGQSTSSGSGQGQVIASADSRTNSVVVRGPSDAIEIIAAMLEQLDDRETETAHVKVFQLRYAEALNVADVINQLFGDSANSSSNQGIQAVFQRGGRGGRAGDFGDFGMDNQGQSEGPGSMLTVSAAADGQTNTVVVTGPEAMLEIVSEVITGLDKQVPNVADVRVFHLEYADATNVASLVNEIFSASTNSSSRSSSRQNQQVQFGGRGGFAQMAAQTGSTTASDVAVVASADSRTNSVVVAGPPETMEIVAGIVHDLDQNPEQERQIFVYPLKNGSASNIVTILNSIFDQMQSLNQQGTGRTGGQQFQGGTGGTGTANSSSSGNDLSEETYFEADAETNAVLVMTSTKNYEKIKPILDTLDKQVGQVLIKCLFAEITHSNNVDLGAEFSAWNLRGAGDSNNVEVSTIFGAPTGGLTASVFDNTLDLTIRALQDTGKLNILSRPYILTSNQQEASIIVGNRVPFATGTTTVAGQTQITTEYQDVGISLSVTPSINPEGLVIMTVSPEISSTTGDEIRVSNDLSLPVFATRSSTTKVAVRDGQTIVIGGLIQDEIRDTVSKVPVLGDVPLLGRLFKRTQKNKTKTELLIFLTPHVAPDALTLAQISDAERDRSNLRKDETVAPIYQSHIEGMGGLHNSNISDPNRL